MRPASPKIIFTEEAIRGRIAELAGDISRDYEGVTPVFVGVLTGAFIFLADLCRAVKIDCEIDFVRADSYGSGTVSSGKAAVTLDTKLDLSGREVLLVDEIVDTGITLKALVGEIKSLGAASVKVCALVDKRERREADVTVDYAGFVIEDGFLVGYGLDAAERMRNLPAICRLD